MSCSVYIIAHVPGYSDWIHREGFSNNFSPMPEATRHKIGYSADPWKRVVGISWKEGTRDLRLVRTTEAGNAKTARELERALHALVAHAATDQSEWFTLDAMDLWRVKMTLSRFERDGLVESNKIMRNKTVKRGRRARVWTPEERETIETWDGSVPGLAKALGCSIGKAHATLKACEEVAP